MQPSSTSQGTAMAMFDHGDARSKEIADAALASGQMTLLLRDESDQVVVRVRVTDLMRRVLTDCKQVRPATYAQFVECTHAEPQPLTRLAAGWTPMGRVLELLRPVRRPKTRCAGATLGRGSACGSA